MTFDTALESARLLLGGALVIANFIVWYGVYLERESAPAEEQQRGWRILVRGLAAETAIGLLIWANDGWIGVRQTSEIATAQNSAADANREAGLLGVDVKNLHGFVTDKEKQIGTQFRQFKTFSDQQDAKLLAATNDEKARVTTALAGVARDRARLETARSSAEGSASKAAQAADAATRTNASMTATLATENQMAAQMRAAITRRVLTDASAAGLVSRLKEFPGTPYCLYVNDDDDSRHLMAQLFEVLKTSGWVQHDGCLGEGFIISLPDSKGIPLFTSTGVGVEIAESEVPMLKAPVVALVEGLIAVGVPAQGRSALDAKMAKIFDRQTVHIFIGARN